MLKCRTTLEQTRGIYAHVDNRRPLTAQANTNTSLSMHWHWCTNTAKCKRKQTPDGCTGASASQNTAGTNVDKGGFTDVCAQHKLRNSQTLFVANSVKLHSPASYCTENTTEDLWSKNFTCAFSAKKSLLLHNSDN